MKAAGIIAALVAAAAVYWHVYPGPCGRLADLCAELHEGRAAPGSVSVELAVACSPFAHMHGEWTRGQCAEVLP